MWEIDKNDIDLLQNPSISLFTSSSLLLGAVRVITVAGAQSSVVSVKLAIY